MPPPASWFAGRTTFRNPAVSEDGVSKVIFEERLVLVWATEFEEACVKLRAEAERYRKSNPELELVDSLVVYCTQEQEISDGVEVWSLLRESEMSATEYIEHYHATERESFLVWKASPEAGEANR